MYMSFIKYAIFRIREIAKKKLNLIEIWAMLGVETIKRPPGFNQFLIAANKSFRLMICSITSSKRMTSKVLPFIFVPLGFSRSETKTSL